jgi:tetratricopeptide (TPR) repeat protein
LSEHRLKYSVKPHSRVSPQRGIRVEEVCIYHIAEIYLYEYYKRPEEYRIAPKERIDALMEKAAQQEKTGGIIGAQQNYEKALQLNPVSTEIYWKLIDIDFRLNKLEDLHARTEEVYPYLCTRAEMAHYYRWLGYYYLETYKPELSEALYRYSTLFSKNEQAEHEITYLEAALGKKMPAYSQKELQDKLSEAKIPVGPSSVTLALLVKAGEEAQQKSGAAEDETTAINMRQQALDCYRMVFDLTLDPEIGERIRRLGST